MRYFFYAFQLHQNDRNVSFSLLSRSARPLNWVAKIEGTDFIISYLVQFSLELIIFSGGHK